MLRHAQYRFHRLHQAGDVQFTAEFEFMRDVEKGFVPYNKKGIIWPVRSSEYIES